MSTTLYHGDCLEEMNKIPDKSIDMILCDLPYGITQNKWDSVISFDLLWEKYNRIVKDNGAIVLHCQQPFTSQLILSNPSMFKYCWIWSKHQCTGFLNAKKQPLRNCEDIAVFYKRQCTYNPQMRKGKPQIKNTGGKSSNYNDFTYQPHISEEYYPTTLLDFPLPRFKGGTKIVSPHGQVCIVAIAADCKSVTLIHRRFDSCLTHQSLSFTQKGEKT